MLLCKKTYITNPKTNFGVSKVAHLMGDQWHIVMCLSVSLLVHKWPSTNQICLSCVLGMIILPYSCWSLIVFSSTKRVTKICLLSINWLCNRCKVECLFLVGISFFWYRFFCPVHNFIYMIFSNSMHCWTLSISFTW